MLRNGHVQGSAEQTMKGIVISDNTFKTANATLTVFGAQQTVQIKTGIAEAIIALRRIKEIRLKTTHQKATKSHNSENDRLEVPVTEQETQTNKDENYIQQIKIKRKRSGTTTGRGRTD